MGSLTGCGDTNTETQATGSATSETQGTVASSEVEEVKEPVELTYYGKILGASSTSLMNSSTLKDQMLYGVLISLISGPSMVLFILQVSWTYMPVVIGFIV